MAVSTQFHTPATLPQKRRPYQLNSELGGNQSRSGGFEEEKNFLYLSNCGSLTVLTAIILHNSERVILYAYDIAVPTAC